MTQRIPDEFEYHYGESVDNDEVESTDFILLRADEEGSSVFDEYPSMLWADEHKYDQPDTANWREKSPPC